MFKFSSNEVVYVYNPNDVKSLAIALWLKASEHQEVYSVFEDLSFLLKGGYDVKYVNFSPMVYNDARVVFKKKLTYDTYTTDISEKEIEDELLRRTLYNLRHFNDKNATSSIVSFVHNNLDNVVNYLSGATSVLLIQEQEDIGNYLKFSSIVKKKTNRIFEKIVDSYNPDVVRWGAIRSNDTKEAIVASRLVSLAGFNVVHQQASSVGILQYS